MIEWPAGLNSCIMQSKRREQLAGYREIQLTSGAPVVEIVTNDTPAFFDLEFVFSRGQARAFQAWLSLHDMQSNPQPFNFPVQTEAGLTTQEVRFTSGGYPQATGQSGGVFTYAARVVAINYTQGGN